MMPGEQRIVRFTGRVQGVGFRFTAIRAAGGYDVTGYVRNCPDGSVECVAEGEGDQINAFLAELSQRMGGYISDMTQETAPATGRFSSFTVGY